MRKGEGDEKSGGDKANQKDWSGNPDKAWKAATEGSQQAVLKTKQDIKWDELKTQYDDAEHSCYREQMFQKCKISPEQLDAYMTLKKKSQKAYKDSYDRLQAAAIKLSSPDM